MSIATTTNAAQTSATKPTARPTAPTTDDWTSTQTSPIAIAASASGSRLARRATSRIMSDARHSGVTTAVITLVTLLCSANLIDVYGSPALWALAALPSTLAGCLIALAGARGHIKPWLQIVLMAVFQFIIGPIASINETTIAHIIPTVSTFTRGFVDTFASFKYVISMTPPLGASGGGLMALWTVDLWLAFLACILALASHKVLVALSAVPIAANLSISALLGTSSGTLTTCRGITVTLILILWLSWQSRALEAGRLASIAIITVLAAAIAFGGSLAPSPDRLTLREQYDPPLNPYQFTSPLSGMRELVKDHKKDTLLTVEGLPAGTPVRLAVMDRFDGNVWNLSDSKAVSKTSDGANTDSSDYRHVGSSIATDGKGASFTATFTVHHGLSEQWLPLAGSASQVTPSESGSDQSFHDDFYYNTGTHSAILERGTGNGLKYTETGLIATTPSDSQIAKAQVASVSQPDAKDIPDSADKLAPALAGGQSTGGRSAQLLAQGLKTRGWFSHGLGGDYPSLPGHGNFRIDSMLADDGTMVGDSEQYASAMAMMARKLGLPSRVVLGFLPKDRDGAISKARTSTGHDGKPGKTNFKGNDIAAWVEIDLKGYGWTAFYPTPKETKVPDKDQDLTPPHPRDLVRQPPVPLTDPLHDKNQAHGQSGLKGDDAGPNGNASLQRALAVARRVALYSSPVWIILLICLAIIAAKAIQLARLKRRGTPAERVASGYRSVAMLANQSGATLSGTRRQQADQLSKQLGLDPTDVRDFSRTADWATYSGHSVTEQAAARFWKHAETIRGKILASQHGWRKIRTSLSLKGMWPSPAQRRKRAEDTPPTRSVQSVQSARQAQPKPTDRSIKGRIRLILARMGHPLSRKDHTDQ